ncbi:hypothetical protein [Devosia sp. DBB001]|nr:hypothetical protein [Devosia sp. DBB001]
MAIILVALLACFHVLLVGSPARVLTVAAGCLPGIFVLLALLASTGILVVAAATMAVVWHGPILVCR